VTESLPKGSNGKAHHAALAYVELPAFMEALRGRNSVSARALEFTVLTAARTGETLGATWDEINLTAKTWTIPARRKKAGKPHKVPLSDRAIEILKALPRHRSGQVFFANAEGRPLAGTAMLEILHRMCPGTTVHGTARSSFTDWSHERTNYPK